MSTIKVLCLYLSLLSNLYHLFTQDTIDFLIILPFFISFFYLCILLIKISVKNFTVLFLYIVFRTVTDSRTRVRTTRTPHFMVSLFPLILFSYVLPSYVKILTSLFNGL